MAEIKLEKKKPVWPWVLLALLIMALLAFLLLGSDDDDDMERMDQDTTEQVEAPETNSMAEESTAPIPAVEEYVTFLKANGGEMGLDHEYTHRAFTLLIAAMQATADRAGYAFDQDMNALNERVDKIKKDPLKLTHANTINEGFTEIVKSFGKLQAAEFPEMEGQVTDLEKYQQELEPAEPTLEQKETVKGFFDQAAVILEKMNENS